MTNFFHKAIYILSILGLLTTVHLYIMNERGFDRGCLGIETAQEFEESFDCESVVQEGLVIFGLSNITLGFLFYALLILCTIGAVLSNNRKNILLIKTRDRLIIIGFIYSIYLSIYQHFILEEYCALCLISGLISLVLFILLITSGFIKKSSVPDKANKKLFLLLFTIGIAIAGLDIYYFSTLEKFTHAEKINENDIDNIKMDENEFNPDDCSFDTRKKSVKGYKNLISDYDIQYGNKNSEYVLIEIFDPNCTHCKKLHPKMKEIISRFDDDILVVIKPNPLWSHSIIQIQALYIAHEAGLFNEMVEEQFSLQTPGKGLNLKQLLEISEKIGLDKEIVSSRIKTGHFVKKIMADNNEIKATGITSAPTLLFNGKPIAGKSRNADCVNEFIKRD